MPPTYSETFLCTALPAGKQGDALFLDVLVSPRLMSSDGAPAAIENWPNAKAWPSVRPAWTVTIEQDGVQYTFTATEPAAGTYDTATWDAYPARPGVTQTPYQPVDRSETPIFSYPAAMVRDAARDLHVHALVNSRNEFPDVESLRVDSEVFRCLLEAADPALADRMRIRQLGGPVADADVECHEAFAMAEGCFYNGRPGSERGPVITLDPATVKIKQTPTVRILGTGLAGATSVVVVGGEVPFRAEFAVVSDGELTFTAPRLEAPGTRTVLVTTPTGTGSATLTYVPDVPVITSLSPKSVRTADQPLTITITGTEMAAVTDIYLIRRTDEEFFIIDRFDPASTSDTVVTFRFVPAETPFPPDLNESVDRWLMLESPAGRSDFNNEASRFSVVGGRVA